MKKLLIAENNRDNITFYESLFSRHNYRVLIATDSRESLKKYKSAMEEALLSAATAFKTEMSGETKGEEEWEEWERRRRLERLMSLPFSARLHIAMPFDAVLLNHRVSDTDGISVAKEILSVNPRQRVVFVSESVKYTAELQNEFNGAVDVIQKPFVAEALMELLESAEIYRALGDLGVNVRKLKEYKLYHFQLFVLLAACMKIMKSHDESEGSNNDDEEEGKSTGQ